MKRKNRAVSNTVSAIILLAITIIVSLAVAIWLSGITTRYMHTVPDVPNIPSIPSTDNTLTFISVEFRGTDNIVCNLYNDASTITNVNKYMINNNVYYSYFSFSPNAYGEIFLTYTWHTGDTYTIQLFYNDNLLAYITVTA